MIQSLISAVRLENGASPTHDRLACARGARTSRGALKGDTALLARLVAGGAAGVPTAAPEQINQTLSLATQCEERNNDFSRTASPTDRLAQAQAALAHLTLSGAMNGTLAFTSSGLVSGQIAGRRIQGRASIVRETVSQQLRQVRLRRFHALP